MVVGQVGLSRNHPAVVDHADEDDASVVRMDAGRTETDQAGVGNLPVAGNEGAVAEVFAAAVEIAHKMEPFPVQIQCRRLDFPVDRCRCVLCRGKPAPRSRRPSAHRRDHDP